MAARCLGHQNKVQVFVRPGSRSVKVRQLNGIGALALRPGFAELFLIFNYYVLGRQILIVQTWLREQNSGVLLGRVDVSLGIPVQLALGLYFCRYLRWDPFLGWNSAHFDFSISRKFRKD